MKLALAKPTFNTDPDENLAPVDVYKQNSEETVNSYQEAAEQNQGFFDNLANISPGDILKQATASLQSAAQAAASLALGASMKNPLSGLAGAAGALGLGGLGQSLKTLAAGVGMVKNIGSAKNISQILGAAGRFAGQDGAAITKLAYSMGSMERNLSSFSSLNSKSGLAGIARGLSLGAGMSSAVGSILGDMSPAMTQSYNAAASSALQIAGVVQTGTSVTGRTNDPGNASVINRAIAEFRGDNYQTKVSDSAGLAGSIAGLTYASHLTGLPGAFKALTEGVNDVQVCKAAAVPLAREAATTGDVGLFMDIAGSKVGSQMQSAVPELASGMIANARAPQDLAQQEYAGLYDNFSAALTRVSPHWKNYQTKGSSLVNAAYVAQNPFMQDLVAAKMNSVMGPAGSNSQSVYPQNSVYNASSVGVTIDPNTAVNNPLSIEDASAPIVTPAAEASGGSIADETFMMLASVFPGESVDAGMKEHFPFFHATLNGPVMGIPV